MTTTTYGPPTREEIAEVVAAAPLAAVIAFAGDFADSGCEPATADDWRAVAADLLAVHAEEERWTSLDAVRAVLDGEPEAWAVEIAARLEVRT